MSSSKERSVPLPSRIPLGLVSNRPLNFLTDHGEYVAKGSFGIVTKYSGPKVAAIYDETFSAMPVIKDGIETYHYNSIAVKLNEMDPRELASMLREVKFLTRIGEHPNVISLLDVVVYKNVLGFVTPLATSTLQTLKTVLTKKALKMCLYQTLSGLAYVHSLGIVHADLKPQNVFVYLSVGDEENGRVLESASTSFSDTQVTVRAVIADLGLSHDSERCWSSSGVRSDNGFTPRYRAPERYLGRRATEASDVWSYAVMAHDVYMRRNLFQPSDELRNTEKWSLVYGSAIVDTFGLPDEEVWPGVTSLKRWKERLDEWKEMAEEGHISEDAMNGHSKWKHTTLDEPGFKKFLSRMFFLDPRKRANARTLLSDTWFDDTRPADAIIPGHLDCEGVVIPEDDEPEVVYRSENVEATWDEHTLLYDAIDKISRNGKRSIGKRTWFLSLALGDNMLNRKSERSIEGELGENAIRVLAECSVYIASTTLEEPFNKVSKIKEELLTCLQHLDPRLLAGSTSFDILLILAEPYKNRELVERSILALKLVSSTSATYMLKPTLMSRVALWLGCLSLGIKYQQDVPNLRKPFSDTLNHIFSDLKYSDRHQQPEYRSLRESIGKIPLLL